MSITHSNDGAARLSHLGVIRARGADAATFLQGQLTNDIAALRPGTAGLAGYCSAKGRLLASFVVWPSAPDEYLLVCSADLLAPTLKRLSMFVMRAKCKLDDASAEWALWGLAGNSATVWLGAKAPEGAWAQQALETGQAVQLPAADGSARYLWAAPGGVAAPPLVELPLATWRWLEIQSGVPLIEAATTEQFVPQMVNLELVGGVSFSKGCYPGQEVVARSQYRGTIKRRASLFDVAADASAGQEIFHSSDPSQPAGMVVNAAAAPQGGSSVLAEVKLAALTGGSLHLDIPDGATLSPRALPYSLAVDEAA